ncbi:hypothetical protein FHS82_000994 [Pseudochelatococcus lubricantis]|uniref:Uncharacterized protein n=1 Tax=Pseudochelatococcus lubricantis TaxID=1538102 RepID=A0ABX0UW41_9HYPH|nr:hypothetical protein [Pseudochelatococcus lubricantis]NIJ57168.1 hypothetical protein [Pseudochelatococcus lubricantis]
MTDTRERLARVIENATLWANSGGVAQSVLAALHLTPSAASALMDGTAVVVPVKLSPEMLEAADEANSDDWTAETDPMFISETTRRIYSAAVAASPYRRKDNA